MSEEITRKGDWFMTRSGTAFWPLDPRKEEIFADDIAHGLSNICRWGGHAKTFYSVAQHCFHVSRLIYLDTKSSALALVGLLHDASEAYIGDMVTPLKRHIPQFLQIEAVIERMVMERFGLQEHHSVETGLPDIVKHYDAVMLATEKRDLTCQGRTHTWNVPVKPEIWTVSPWSPELARSEYENELRRLYQRVHNMELSHELSSPR